MSRRDALHTGLAARASLMLKHPAWATSETERQALITKAIPSTGERLPVVGLGTDKFSNDYRELIKAEIKRMQELGGTVIDTAPAYGDSEALIGEALAAATLREKMFVATELTISGGGDSDTLGGQASFDRSLVRLKTQSVDLLQVHSLNGVDALMPLLQKWKEAGKIRYFGITTSEVDQHASTVEFMRKYPLDFVQVDYSLANRNAASNVLPLAADRRMGVLVNFPFGYGSLFHQTQTRRLPPWAADIDVTSWGQLLLKYVISHPAVTVAIPGSTKVEHLGDNQRAARGRLPDQAMRREMERYWDAEIASAS
jgi:aryl-alcohol dehydrogenase-like predicted oxidoreductase